MNPGSVISLQFRNLFLLFCLTILFACHSSKQTSSSVPPSEKKNDEKLTKKERQNKVETVIKTAYTFKGTPYRIGGMDKKGIDCSGLVKVSYQNAGIQLPRTTRELCTIGDVVSTSRVEKGDLLFFATNKKRSKEINHVGIVSKVNDDNDVYFIHASLQKGVMENKLSDKYYKEAFIKAIRPF